MSKLFIHLIPYDGIGGVESAARSMGSFKNSDFEYSLKYIFDGVEGYGRRVKTFNFVKIFILGFRLGLTRPDYIVVSLWRSSIVGLFARLISPRIQLVTFLHNSKDAHVFDFYLTRLSICFSKFIWVDSRATLNLRVPVKYHHLCRIISFVPFEGEVVTSGGVAPKFIFWGRVTRQKNLIRALKIFSEIKKNRPDAEFLIIGPDGGAMDEVKGVVDFLSLADSVSFLGAMSRNEISVQASGSSFYLQTSDYEGMAMSVVEAMQFGLIPVVSPVGEIPNYCSDDFNSIFVSTDESAVVRILEILDDVDKFRILRERCISAWADVPLYKDSVVSACHAAIN